MQKTVSEASLVAVALTFLSFASHAHAQGAREPRFSIAIERVGGVSGLFLSAASSSDELDVRVRSFALAGPISNPLSAPRLALDYLTARGVTAGLGIAFGLHDVVSLEGRRRADEGGLGLVMLNPRIGLRLPLGKRLDLTPRLGTALGWARIAEGGQESCTSRYDAATGERRSGCKTVDGDSVEMLAALVGMDIVAAIRITETFNLLAGLSYDLVVAASVKEHGGGKGASDGDTFGDGHLSSLALWLGLGGYL